MLRYLAAERREKVAHGASRGKVFRPDKLRSSERNWIRLTFLAPLPGLFGHSAFSPTACAVGYLLPLLRSYLAMCLHNSKK